MKAEFTLSELETIKKGVGAIAGGAEYKAAMTLLLAKTSQAQRADSHVRSTWNAYCGHYGLKPEHLGMTVVVQRREFELTGINPDAPRYPFIAKRKPDGREFRLPRSATLSLTTSSIVPFAKTGS